MANLEPYIDPNLDRRLQLWFDLVREHINGISGSGGAGDSSAIIATFPGTPPVVWVSVNGEIYTQVT